MKQITVVGTGLMRGQLTLDAAEALSSGARVILHTERVGCADWLREKGIAFESLDALYERADDFDGHALSAAAAVIAAAADADVVYGVYDVRDRSAFVLTQRVGKLRVIAGPPVEGALLARLDGACRTVEASDWENFQLSPSENTLIRELNSRELTSEVKLKLMECYPEDARVYLLSGTGALSPIPLYDLDRMKAYDHRSCVLVPAERDLMRLERYGFDELVRVMRVLQSPGGCPWDQAQTHESLRPFMLEETYEAIDAINEGDTDHLYDELGDLLMQVVMQAEIGRMHGEFDLRDATTAICRKMIRRHTHVFSGDSAEGADAVLDLWARNKMKERGQRTRSEVLSEVPRTLPALMRAGKLVEKAARAGVKAERPAIEADAAQALRIAAASEQAEASLGDALLMLCALCRSRGVDPEIALNEASDRFIERFRAAEDDAGRAGRAFPDETRDPAEYWNLVKLSQNGAVRQDLREV